MPRRRTAARHFHVAESRHPRRVTIQMRVHGMTRGRAKAAAALPRLSTTTLLEASARAVSTSKGGCDVCAIVTARDDSDGAPGQVPEIMRRGWDSNPRMTVLQGEIGDHKASHCATLHHGEGGRNGDRDPACFSVLQDDSSRNVTAKSAERIDSNGPFGATVCFPGDQEIPARSKLGEEQSTAHLTASDEALHLAIKLAVDAGEYERASSLLDVAKRTTIPRA
jgi:hypothetical protein